LALISINTITNTKRVRGAKAPIKTDPVKLITKSIRWNIPKVNNQATNIDNAAAARATPKSLKNFDVISSPT
jgi:hypothetical protein